MNSPQTIGTGFIDLSDASRFSGLSVSTLRRLIAEKRLVAYKPTGKVLLELAELRRFLAESKQPAGAA
jgi:excisionase family DNA binding protein